MNIIDCGDKDICKKIGSENNNKVYYKFGKIFLGNLSDLIGAVYRSNARKFDKRNAILNYKIASIINPNDKISLNYIKIL